MHRHHSPYGSLVTRKNSAREYRSLYFAGDPNSGGFLSSLLAAGVTHVMKFSVNPSPSMRGTAELIPRQLAPSVGTLDVGTQASAAPSPTTQAPAGPEDPIYFGSLCFTPHTQKARAIFGSLRKNVPLTFGIVRLLADRHGILRLPDAVRPATTNPSPSPISPREHPSDGFINDSLETAESTSSSPTPLSEHSSGDLINDSLETAESKSSSPTPLSEHSSGDLVNDPLETAGSECSSVYLNDAVYPEDVVSPVKLDTDKRAQSKNRFLNSMQPATTRPI